jgi:hypothetical protein
VNRFIFFLQNLAVITDHSYANSKLRFFHVKKGLILMRTSPIAVLLLAICPTLLAQQPLPTPEAGGTDSTSTSVSTTAVPTKPNTLPDGTPVKLRIGRNISSADAKVGEHVDFEVLEEVQVMGLVVIPKGAIASATVTEAQPKRRMGREGKLGITLDFVRLTDNEKAALTASAGGKGGTHTGAMIGAMAATAIFTLGGSALFLLMHGKDITIQKGAETTAYINGDMTLDMVKFGAAPVSPIAGTTSVATSQTSLSIDSTPTGADIEVDGNFVGDTPSTVTINTGTHKISVKKKGFVDWNKSINITGGSIKLNAELEQEPIKQ